MNLYGYVGNDPVNNTDPFGMEEREVTRRISVTGSKIKRKVSITVEAGDLSQSDTEGLLSGVSDSFFQQFDGQNLSGNGKPVSGDNKNLVDQASVASQLVGTAAKNDDDAGVASAFRRVKRIEVIDRDPGPLAQMDTNINNRNFGRVTLFSGAFNGKVNAFGRSGLFRSITHETLHLHRLFRTKLNYAPNTQKRQIHADLDEAAAQLVRKWGLQ